MNKHDEFRKRQRVASVPGEDGREAGARERKEPWRSASSDLIKDVL